MFCIKWEYLLTTLDNLIYRLDLLFIGQCIFVNFVCLQPPKKRSVNYRVLLESKKKAAEEEKLKTEMVRVTMNGVYLC